MNGHHAHRAPDTHDVRHEPDGGGIARDLERHVHALAARPVIGELDDVGAGTDHLEAEATQQLDAERVDFRDGHPRAAMARDQANEGADGPSPEDEHGVALLDLRASDVVGRDGQRLHHGGIIVGQGGRHLDEAIRLDRPALLHPSGRVDPEHLELVAEKARAHLAGPAGAAEAQGLHDDSVALGEAALCRSLRDFREGLVADDAALGHAVVEVALEDVQVRPADADPLDVQERFARARARLRRRPRPEPAGSFVERRAHG